MSCSRIISEKGFSSTPYEPLTLSSMCPTSAPQNSGWRHAEALLPATAISAGTDMAAHTETLQIDRTQRMRVGCGIDWAQLALTCGPSLLKQATESEL